MGWHTRSPQAADAAVAADAFAQPLHETAGDPAFIGYFLMNEPTWGFTQETGGGHAIQHPNLLSHKALADFLQRIYPDDSALAAAWKMGDFYHDPRRNVDGDGYIDAALSSRSR